MSEVTRKEIESKLNRRYERYQEFKKLKAPEIIIKVEKYLIAKGELELKLFDLYGPDYKDKVDFDSITNLEEVEKLNKSI